MDTPWCNRDMCEMKALCPRRVTYLEILISLECVEKAEREETNIQTYTWTQKASVTMCEGHSGTTGLLFLQLITVSSKFVFFLLSVWWSDEQMNKRKDKHRCQTDKELMCLSLSPSPCLLLLLHHNKHTL